MTNETARYILITGAAGTGTSTLAHALAKELSAPHLEADDFLWLPSNPPYQHLADKTQRGERLLQEMRSHGRAVVAGSVMDWGQPLENEFDLVVFLYLPVELRLERLERREVERFGQAKPEFLVWAAQYDEGGVLGRSLGRHQEWLSVRTCAVLRLEGDVSVKDRVLQILDALDGLNRSSSVM
ncbi:AAA family ATPase [Pseudomonas fragi]|uniref:AAA family ATPase n=1 Tax=Pseudomonas fragi TaxID=296 RepID=UPI0014741BF9|nr:AAA family ATPase [Pseudomonas fragi]NNB17741.1 AAA family ATPase [Pseudomonas fragi]NNB19633.1 AAA family ATPase [Pseudomonas fragi]